MFVDTAKLHSGAAESYRASEHAQAGADSLSAVPPLAGMFGWRIEQSHAAPWFHQPGGGIQYRTLVSVDQIEHIARSPTT